MKLLVAPDSALMCTPDGKYWSKTIYSYDFFQRYLEVFDEIIVASRTKHVEYNVVEGYMRSDGPNMSVMELPDMHGMKDYCRKIIPFAFSSMKASKVADCALFRLPSVPASMVLLFYKHRKKPYALEVVVDPEDAYASNIIAQKMYTEHLEKECAKANGVSYVTKLYLQAKYPSYARIYGPDENHFESYYSTIRLDDSFYSISREYVGKSSYHIIHTANNMNNDVKGHEVLIRAVEIVLSDGFDVTLTFVGDGKKREYFENLVKELGIEDRVVFTGMLSGNKAVREELLKADMLVFPTKAEGLPRTVIEAMAVGLPCISTPVAGIPELLDQEDLLPPEDFQAFADRIEYFINHPTKMEEKSRRNIDVAREYREDVLCERRNGFYSRVKRLSEGVKG